MEKLGLEYLTKKIKVLEELEDIALKFNEDIMKNFGDESAEDLDSWKIYTLIHDERISAIEEYSKATKQRQ